MARKVFFSFHYKPDHWRASQVRQKGAIEGEAPVSDDDWEKVTKGGDPAIEKWIDGQISGKSCAVVLLGADTAGRKWIEHGICKARNEKKAYLEFTSTNSRITTRSSQRRPPLRSDNFWYEPVKAIYRRPGLRSPLFGQHRSLCLHKKAFERLG